ncbi:MAG: hypothetical protein NXH85_16010 [Pseudomonadaceae bacterium]|nr:hypothetical protein [Pseudomonadaceae bacterium]
MPRSIVVAPRAGTTAGSATRGGLDDDEFSAPQPAPDDYTDRLVKLIPAEVVAFYLFAVSSLESAANAQSVQSFLLTAQCPGDVHSISNSVATGVPWLVMLFSIFATYFYLKYPLKVKDSRQLLITTGAFCVWAFSLGFPFTQFAWYTEAYGGILLAAYTLISPHIPLSADKATA